MYAHWQGCLFHSITIDQSHYLITLGAVITPIIVMHLWSQSDQTGYIITANSYYTMAKTKEIYLTSSCELTTIRLVAVVSTVIFIIAPPIRRYAHAIVTDKRIGITRYSHTKRIYTYDRKLIIYYIQFSKDYQLRINSLILIDFVEGKFLFSSRIAHWN